MYKKKIGRESNCSLHYYAFALVLPRRDVFMEKHWRSAVNKSICDYFFEAQAKASSPEDIPPVITTPHYYLVSVYRNKVYFVAVIQNEGEVVHDGAVMITAC